MSSDRGPVPPFQGGGMVRGCEDGGVVAPPTLFTEFLVQDARTVSLPATVLAAAHLRKRAARSSDRFLWGLLQFAYRSLFTRFVYIFR